MQRNSSSSPEKRILYLDGTLIGEGIFDCYLDIDMDNGSHVLESISSSGREASLEISTRDENHEVELYILADSSMLSFHYSKDEISHKNLKSYKITEKTPFSKLLPPIIYSIAVTSLYLLIGIIVCISGECPLWALLVGIGFILLADALSIKSGHWSVPIPLPFFIISISRNSKGNPNSGKNFIYQVVIFILQMVAIVFLTAGLW